MDNNYRQELNKLNDLIQLRKINNATSEENFNFTGNTLTCSKHGDYPERNIEIWNGKRITSKNCPKCVEENNQAEKNQLERMIEKQKNIVLDHKKLKSGISKRNIHVSFKDFKTESEGQAKVLKTITGIAERLKLGEATPNVILTGSVGTGKTMIASCLVNEVIGKKGIAIVKLQDMLRSVKETYSKDSTFNESDIIKKFASIDFLIVDEVGIGRDTDNDKNIIFDIFDNRYQNMLPTMIISNLDMEKITATLGSRVIDRLREGGGILLGCDWGSLRA